MEGYRSEAGMVLVPAKDFALLVGTLYAVMETYRRVGAGDPVWWSRAREVEARVKWREWQPAGG